LAVISALLVVVLLKGVPARTTQAVQIGGVLNREAMDLVLNPHDAKAVEAADYLKRRAGGKVVALTMGPDIKLIPLMKPLFDAEVSGVDEEYVLSDRKMAGSDTLATSYAVALGVKKVVERHLAPLDELADAIKRAGYSEAVKSKAAELYRANLLPNKVYSELPSVKDTIVRRFLEGRTSAEEAVSELAAVKEEVSRFVVVAGVKTTDGETGSVGPQVAEGVSELMGKTIPHATYVEDFEVDPRAGTVTSERRIGYLSQKLEMRLPALMTISQEFRPRGTPAGGQPAVRLANYRGKVTQATKWTADDLGADPKRLGLAGSPTIVGSGVDIGRPPVQKKVGETLVFLRQVERFELESKQFGPFAPGDLAAGLPAEAVERLKGEGAVGVFSVEMLARELLR
jgi:electron transfer flavoprotein beta subunit